MCWSRRSGWIAAALAGLAWGVPSASADWGPPVTVGPGTSQLALAGGGGSLALVWEDRARRLHVRVRSRGGAIRTTTLRRRASCDRPHVAVGPRGDVAVAWQQLYSGSPSRCSLLATTAARGRGFRPTQLVSTPGEQAIRPSLAVGAGGTTALSWLGDDYIQAAVAPRGSGFGPDENASRFEHAYYVATGVDSQDRAVVVWPAGYHDGKLRRARRAKRGGFSAPRTIVSSSPGLFDYTFFDLTASFDAAGRSVVLWNPIREDGSEDILALAGSHRQVLEANTRAGGLDFASLAVAPNGTALAVWPVNINGQNAFHAALRPPGGTFGPVFVVPGAEGVIGSVAAAIDNTGMGVIAWWNFGVRAVTILPGGQIGPPRQLAESSGGAPGTAVDGAGRAVVAWHTDNVVQMATFTAGTP